MASRMQSTGGPGLRQHLLLPTTQPASCRAAQRVRLSDSDLIAEQPPCRVRTRWIVEHQHCANGVGVAAPPVVAQRAAASLA